MNRALEKRRKQRNIPPINSPSTWVSSAPLKALREKQRLVVSVAGRPVLLLLDGDAVRAVDNRCPHVGFPLSKGTVEAGMLTCHWHHARFDADSGCAFDLFADDVPAYDVKIEGDQVFVAAQPRNPPGVAHYRNRLDVGLAQNIEIILCKSIVGLVEAGVSVAEIATQMARFGSRYHESWSSGMTSLTIALNLAPRISQESLIYLLCFAARELAANCDGQPARRDRNALDGNQADFDRIKAWLRDWLRVRHRDGSERTVLTAAARFSIPQLNDLLFDCLQDRVYANSGHLLDFTNKLLEMRAHLDSVTLADLLPILMPDAAGSRGSEETSAWRTPVDVITLIEESETELRELDFSKSFNKQSDSSLPDLLLGEDPAATCRHLVAALRDGTDPLQLAREIAHAASLRLARFPQSNDLGDWFTPVHTFFFSNAVAQGIRRQEGTTFGVVRGLLVAATAVYLERFLNIPPARLPDETRDFGNLPTDSGALLDSFISALDSCDRAWQAPAFVARYIRLGHDEDRLIDRLVFAVLREDLDFHHIQAIEAAARQSQLWPAASLQREHLYTGAARYLASHCPTRRTASRMTRIAIRLQHGGAIYEEESAE